MQIKSDVMKTLYTGFSLCFSVNKDIMANVNYSYSFHTPVTCDGRTCIMVWPAFPSPVPNRSRLEPTDRADKVD